MAVFHYYMRRLSQRGWALFDGAGIDAQSGCGRVMLSQSCFVLHSGATAGRKLCYMFAGWFPGALDWVNESLGRPHRLTAEEVQCAGEGHANCVFEVRARAAAG